MANWLERARCEILKTPDRGTANTDIRNLSAVTAVPKPGQSEYSGVSCQQWAIPEGPITAVLIESPIVGLVWFAFDDDFNSGDEIPVFFASELPFLRKMSTAELRRRYAEKQALGRGWIRNRIDEPTKH